MPIEELSDTSKWSDFKVIEYPSKNWEETDVEIAITHCGYVIISPESEVTLNKRSYSVCGSDVHKLTSGWGEYEVPLVVG